jgi:hypothetical protein
MTAELVRAVDRMLARRQPRLIVRTALISIGGTLAVLVGLYLWFQPFCWGQPDGGRVCGWIERK